MCLAEMSSSRLVAASALICERTMSQSRPRLAALAWRTWRAFALRSATTMALALSCIWAGVRMRGNRTASVRMRWYCAHCVRWIAHARARCGTYVDAAAGCASKLGGRAQLGAVLEQLRTRAHRA